MMRIMKYFKHIYVLVFLAFFVACEDSSDVLDYKGPVSVKFTAPAATELFLFTNAGQEAPVTSTIDLIGSPSGSSIDVTISVDESSTAIEGVHYSLASTTVSIPAGEVSAALPVTAILDGFGGDPGNKQTLVINITSANGAEVAVSLSQIELTMSITCPSEIPLGAYAEVGTGTGAGIAVELTKNEDGSYTLSQMNFDYYSPGYDPVPGTFVDVCNTLTLQGVPTDVFGIAWIGTGTYDPATGSLRFSVSDQTYNPTFVVEMLFEKQ